MYSELLYVQFNFCTRQHEIHASRKFLQPRAWSPIGVLTSSSRSKCSLNLPIPMVILGIPHPVHTFNSEFPSHFSLESRIPAFTEGICLKDKDNANPGSRKTQVFGNPYMSPVDRPGVVVTGLSRLCVSYSLFIWSPLEPSSLKFHFYFLSRTGQSP